MKFDKDRTPRCERRHCEGYSNKPYDTGETVVAGVFVFMLVVFLIACFWTFTP